jgi:hypothetical protein
MAAPLVAVRTRRWAWWSWRRRALDAENGVQGLLEERSAWKGRALRAERQAVREREEREGVWQLKAEEVLRAKTDLYERIAALEAELEDRRGNPG